MARLPETVVIKVVDARNTVEPLDDALDAAYRRGFQAGLAHAEYERTHGEAAAPDTTTEGTEP